MMHTYSFTLDDSLVGKLSSHFSSHASMHNWLQNELELIIIQHTNASQVRTSEVKSLKIAKELDKLSSDGNESFFKLDSILPPARHTNKELLNDYLNDKYGL